MSVSIPAQYASFVAQIIAGGSYQSESEVVAAALALLERRHKHDEYIREQLRPAIEELERGEGIEIPPDKLDEYFDRIIAEGEAQLAAERKSA